jgi:hypothetical protein
VKEDEMESGVRFSINDANISVNETSDFIWAEISLRILCDEWDTSALEDMIYIHIKSTIQY